MAQFPINTITELLQNSKVKTTIVKVLPETLIFGDLLTDWDQIDNNLFLSPSELREHLDFEDFANKINPQLLNRIKDFNDFCAALVAQFSDLYYDFKLLMEELQEHQEDLEEAQAEYNELVNDPTIPAEDLVNERWWVDECETKLQQDRNRFATIKQAIIDRYTKITKELILKYDERSQTR